MSPKTYNEILNSLVGEDHRSAMETLWRKYQLYHGAVMYSKTPEVKVICNCNTDTSDKKRILNEKIDLKS